MIKTLRFHLRKMSVKLIPLLFNGCHERGYYLQGGLYDETQTEVKLIERWMREVSYFLGRVRILAKPVSVFLVPYEWAAKEQLLKNKIIEK